MRRLLLLAVLMFVLVLAAPTQGQSAEMTLSPSDAFTGRVDLKPRSARAALARSLLAEVEKLSNSLPTPTPSEMQWVERESAEIDRVADDSASVQRRFRFYASPEFNHVKLYSALSGARLALKCAADSTETTRQQIACWATVSLLFNNNDLFSDGIRTLQSSGRLPKKISAFGGENYDILTKIYYHFYSTGIQSHIVIPYLSGGFD